MFKHPHPVDGVGAGTAAPGAVQQPVVTPSPAAPEWPQTANAPAAGPQVSPHAPVQADQAELHRQLEAALKNSGYKAEITTESGGYTILKIVQSQTGQVILQMPSKTALAIVAALEKSGPSGSSSVPAGTVFSELA